MNDNQKDEIFNNSEENNSKELNDSEFQEEGVYYLEKMPKFKYEIKIIHPSPNKVKKPKTPDKIIPSERFTIASDIKNNKLSTNKNILLNNNKYENYYYNSTLYKSRSPRMSTIKFYSGGSNISKDIEDNTFEKAYTRFLKKNKRYKNKNDNDINDNICKKDNDYICCEKEDNYNYNYNKDYNNSNFYKNDNNFNYNNDYNYNYIKKENNCHCHHCHHCHNGICHNYYNKENYYNYYNNNNCLKNDSNYIIEIYPTKPCICQKEINKTINDYFDSRHFICNNNKRYKYNNNIGCLCNMCDNQNQNMNNYYIKKRNNNNYYSSINSPCRNNYLKQKEKFNKKFYHSENININSPSQNKSLNNNYYYDINNNLNNNIIENHKNFREMENNSQKVSKKLKKITIKNNKNRNNNYINERNNSFLSVENIKTNIKNMSPNKSLITINNKRKNKNYFCSSSPNNHLNNTMILNERKSSNVMIHKSSDRQERLKIVKIDEKIKPLEIKKVVKKPTKETIRNENGTTTNIIKQTYVLTSIENKPIINKNKDDNSKDEKSVKERITKIYTTLTRQEIDENNTKQSNDINIDNENENEDKNEDNDEQKNYKDQSDNNLNSENNNINNINNNNDKGQYIIINNCNNNENIEIYNDLLINRNNNNNSFNYSSLYSNITSNINENSEQNNTRINNIIKYIKYLYIRCTNLTSYESEKAKSLSNYFLNLIEEEKVGVLNKLKDGNNEDKKIYDKLMSILKENDSVINDNQDYKKKQSNIIFKKKKLVK